MFEIHQPSVCVEYFWFILSIAIYLAVQMTEIVINTMFKHRSPDDTPVRFMFSMLIVPGAWAAIGGYIEMNMVNPPPGMITIFIMAGYYATMFHYWGIVLEQDRDKEKQG